jgi:type I restriction enzyme M protein
LRILVHVHAYGDPSKVPALLDEHAGRISRQIDLREIDEAGLIEAQYQLWEDKLDAIDSALADGRQQQPTTKSDEARLARMLSKLEGQREKIAAKIAERDEHIADVRRRAESDRHDLTVVCDELLALYGDPEELLKHARVVGLDEIEENEFNLNIPRYVDTFVPERRIEVADALGSVERAIDDLNRAESELTELLRSVGYGK